MTIHQPVLLKEIIDYLRPQSGQNFIDCTFGGGGHAREILDRIGPQGKLLALDVNPDARPRTANKNLIFINDNFKNLIDIVKKNFSYPISGILLDLGLSSDELENSGRGFSFQLDEPLDMRFDLRQELTAAHIINSYSLDNLYAIFKNFGEYSHARRLSQNIYRQRQIKKFYRTSDLVALILEIEPRHGRSKLHPATKVFQALRLAVNDELNNLQLVLPQAVSLLEPGGRLVIISFHALEDRIVKNFFRDLARQDNSPIILLTKKPISPNFEEIKSNPRSRSAKMRVIEKQ